MSWDMFDGYLNANDIEALTKAALDGGILSLEREILFDALPSGFVAGLKTSPKPIIQFKLDLIAVNRVERLADGFAPLVQFLRNITSHLRISARPEAEIFERYATRIGNRVEGVPRLPSPAGLPEVIRPEAIIHQDDTVPFAFLQSALNVGESVGRVTAPRFENGVARMVPSGAPWVMNGTAWVIGPGLIVTNHHVINARENHEIAASAADFELQARGTTVVFDFDSDGSQIVSFGVQSLEITDAALDYAVIRLSSPCGRRALRFNGQKVLFLPSTYIALNIIQHPRGNAKRIAFRNNLLSGADNETVRYFTDTDFGSSGAPVCDDNWRVIALHRGALQVHKVNFQGKPSAYVNFGTQVHTLLADIQQRSTALHHEIMDAQH